MNDFHEDLCSQCGAITVIAPEGEKVCTECGCVEVLFEGGGFSKSAHEGVDPRSLDSGLGSEPLQLIRDLKSNSALLVNSWQTVLGYYLLGKRDTFVESCLSDLMVALDGTSDEQFLQCRKLLLKEIRAITDRGLGPSRKKTRQAVVLRALEEATRAWPRIAVLLHEKRFLEVYCSIEARQHANVIYGIV